MKKPLFVFCLVAAFASVISFGSNADAETFGCQANPRIGDKCTKRVTIRLRKVESSGRDEFDRRFEPPLGWAIQDCDTRSGERGRTGEVSGPSCIEVQPGTTTTSSSYVQSQANRVYETIGKLKGQAGNASAQIFGELESRARSEFSDLERVASVHQSKNYGVQIKAWVAVRGGCRNRVFGSCVNWGPGGSLDTDVIVRLAYVGTNQDVNQIAERYITAASRAAANPGSSNPSVNPGSACESLFKEGQGLTAPHVDQSGSTWGGRIRINSGLNGVFDDGTNSTPINVRLDSNERNRFQFVRNFGNGAEQIWQGQCASSSSATGTWSNNFNDGRGTFTISPN